MAFQESLSGSSALQGRVAAAILLVALAAGQQDGSGIAPRNSPADAWFDYVDDSNAALPKILDLRVDCSKEELRVSLEMDGDFAGVVYSMGHFNDPNCTYVKPESGKRKFSFSIPVGVCGTVSTVDVATDMYLENVIVIQQDSLVQTAYDYARRLHCTWANSFSKTVKFAAFEVAFQLDRKHINRLAEAVQLSSSSAPIRIRGMIDTAENPSVSVSVQEEAAVKDALVTECLLTRRAAQVELIDAYGCAAEPRILDGFVKSRRDGNIELRARLHNTDQLEDAKITCNLQLCENQGCETVCRR